MKFLVAVHVASAAAGLLSGSAALLARKGGPMHRRSGRVFVVSMLTMCAAAIALAALNAQAINLVAGSLTAYLVATGMLAVRPLADPARRLERGLMAAACGIGVAALGFGLARGGVLRAPLLLFGVLGLLGSVGDFKSLRTGRLAGGPRLARHLWRMSLALLIATASFFLGPRGRVRAVLPDAVVTTPLLLVPELVVLASLILWLWRVKKPTGIASGVGTREAGALQSSVHTVPLASGAPIIEPAVYSAVSSRGH